VTSVRRGCGHSRSVQVQSGTLETLLLLHALGWVKQRGIVCLLYEGLYPSCTVGQTDISEVSSAFAEDVRVTYEVVSCIWFLGIGGRCAL